MLTLFKVQKGKKSTSLESGLSYDLYVAEEKIEGKDIFKNDRDNVKEVLNIECGIHLDMFVTALRSFLFHYLEQKRTVLGEDADILDSGLMFKIFSFMTRNEY